MRNDTFRRKYGCCLSLTCLIVALAVAQPISAQDSPPKATEFSQDQLEFFEKEVRPLLVKRCFECHGNVGDDLKGGLRLDSRDALIKGGDTGPSLDVEHPEKSLLLDAIRYGETYQMPPKTKLPAEELAILEKWILAKAPWPAETKTEGAAPKKFDLMARKASHWAWKPIVSPPIPQVNDAAWPASNIDRFILAKLEQSKLKPSTAADKRVLIRRLYYDLIGLPSPPARVEEFLRDESDVATEKLVDELLKSPQFGERWARHWLDVVAYAETRGHEFDYDIPGVQHYRDYVIRSINSDLPYDQFAMEHVAGDLMNRRDAKGADESALGTGFWFLGEWLHSPVDIRKDETDRFDRMIDVYSKGFLGLTVSCARCHDHKFDAIAQKDYYALSGFLQGMEYRQYRFETNELEHQAAIEIDNANAVLQPLLKQSLSQAMRKAVEESQPYINAALGTEGSADSSKLDAARIAAWKKELEGVQFTAKEAVSATPALTASRVIENFSDSHQNLIQDGYAFGLHPEAPGDLLISSNAENPLAGIREFGAATLKPAFSRLTTAAKTPRDLGSLGSTIRSGKTLRTKTFVLQQPVLHYLVRGAGRAFASVDSHRAVDGPLHGVLMNAFPAEQGADKSDVWRWVRHELKDYVGHNLHVEFSPDKDAGFEVAMVVEAAAPPFALNQAAQPWKQFAPADFLRIASETLELWANPAKDKTLTHEQTQILGAIFQRKELFAFSTNLNADLKSQTNSLQVLEATWAARLAAPSRTAASAWEGDPVDDELLVRGNSRVSGGPVPRAFLSAILAETKSAEKGANRLDLAKSTVAPGNPLFARVAVNRVWHHLFGRGIVPTVDNFGVLGLHPSHPELLDYLAQDFISDGYSLKRLIKRIVLSKTYQQSSQHNPETDAIDPNNLLLHRMNLRRRDAEGIRDGILAISGRIDLTPLEGESVAVHLTAYMEGRGRPAISGPLDGAGKRSIYLAIRRNFLNPFLAVFDCPIPAAPFGARNQSNVPAQALALLNDPFVHEQAKTWADSLLSKPGTTEERLHRVYEQALSRKATAEELETWRTFQRKQGELFGISATAAENDPRIWLDICHLMFNSKEFLFVE